MNLSLCVGTSFNMSRSVFACGGATAYGFNGTVLLKLSGCTVNMSGLTVQDVQEGAGD